jgi:hypothetical protein
MLDLGSDAIVEFQRCETVRKRRSVGVLWFWYAFAKLRAELVKRDRTLTFCDKYTRRGSLDVVTKPRSRDASLLMISEALMSRLFSVYVSSAVSWWWLDYGDGLVRLIKPRPTFV